MGTAVVGLSNLEAAKAHPPLHRSHCLAVTCKIQHADIAKLDPAQQY